jgi:hypothetical protein
MKIKITKEDLENTQRFVGEGLGAPEARIKTNFQCIHCFN